MVALKIVQTSMQQRGHELAAAAQQRAFLQAHAVKRTFDDAMSTTTARTLRATGIDVLQINVGKVCNQSCRHCHVDAGPDRTEVMADDVVDRVLQVIEATDIPSVDITGGAPELHPRFEEIVARAHSAGKKVLDRCNLTILTTNKYQHLPRFFADHKVEVIASLPFHQASSTDAQRGDGVFAKSITAMRMLNDVGYGAPDTGLTLNLVTNPTGAFLPAKQTEQQALFKRKLAREHNVSFNELFTITNMPVSRYLEWLIETGNLDAYMEKLVGAFNSTAADGVMCRTMVSVGYDGALFDCDFNQMLELPVTTSKRNILDLDAAEFATDAWQKRTIATLNHCYGCTAGQGSSCGGATA